jgi:hypothetical protein
MATHDLSRIVAENGDIYNIKAKGLEDQIQLSLTGDVSGQVTTDLSGNASISTTIANGAVGTAKLADSAVTTGKINDKAVTLDKIADSARGGAVQDNDGVLATHSQVKNYVDSVVAGEGKYRGIQTVATINTWTAANLNNGDRVITEDAGTITLGNFPVVADQELIFWKDAESQVWQTSEGNYKLKQTAATFTGSTLKTPTSFTQNSNGEMGVTFSDIQLASTSQKGVVQLSDAVNSTDTDKAATANAVKTAYDLASTKITKVSGATEGNIPVFDANGEVVDSGKKPSDFEPTSDANEVIAAALNEINARLESVEDREKFGDLVAETVSMQGFPLVGGKSMVLFGSSAPDSAPSYEGQLYLDLTNKDLYFSVGQSSASDWVLAKKKQSAVALTGSTIKTVTRITQNANGTMDATFEDIRSASTTQKGVVQLSDSTASASSETAATSAAVKQAYDLAASKQETITWMTDAEALLLWTDAWNAAT